MRDRRWRRIRERDGFDRRVWRNVPVRRMDCRHCEARVTERIAWLAGHARITRRLLAWVEALARMLPIAQGVKLTGLHWHTIKESDRLRLQALHGRFDQLGGAA